MNKALLMYYLQLNNITIAELSRYLSISRQNVYQKISGEFDFKAREIRKIKDLLNLSADEVDDIFFKELVS